MRRAACALVLLAGCGGGEPAPERPAQHFDAAREAGAEAETELREARGRYATARVVRRTQLRRTPGGRVVATLGRRTEFGSPRVLSVLGERDGWLRVLAAELPNRTSGWIPAAAARRGATDWHIVVDRSARRLRLRRGERTLHTMTVAVGRPANPTPLGRFAVTDKLRPRDAASPYGCCAVALTGHQTKLVPGWPGGDRLAIHDTPAQWSVGRAASLGCLRGRAADLRRLMRRVPLGAPVFIRA